MFFLCFGDSLLFSFWPFPRRRQYWGAIHRQRMMLVAEPSFTLHKSCNNLVFFFFFFFNFLLMCNGMSRYRMKTFIHFSCRHYINCEAHFPSCQCHTTTTTTIELQCFAHGKALGHQIWAQARLHLMWVLTPV